MVEKHVWIVLKENMAMDKVFIDTNITGSILEDFKDEYRKCTDYMVRVHYTDGFRKNNNLEIEFYKCEN